MWNSDIPKAIYPKGNQIPLLYGSVSNVSWDDEEHVTIKLPGSPGQSIPLKPLDVTARGVDSSNKSVVIGTVSVAFSYSWVY